MSDNKLTQTDVSLNPPSTDLVNIKINGIALQVPKGENLIESARRIGIDVPYFCYHPRLSKGDAANCRMCLVEVSNTGPDGSVRKMPKPQTACTMPAAEGMVIETESETVVRDRKGMLEFLLINHPLDCPVCDRGGECPLQNNALFYGPPTTRYIEEKRHLPKAYPLSEHVVFDRERCIHCARCTRFTEDISGDAQLGFLKRGADMEVGTFSHTSYASKFSGNVIELCPVGALLSRNYRFKARPWDLLTQRSVCSRCSNGCNIKFDYRVDQIQRVNARLNEDVNEEWTCDRGKFGHDYISSEKRLRRPLVKRDGKWYEIGWNEAYDLLTSKLKEAGSKVGGIGGERCTNEDNFAFQKLFRGTLKSGNLDHRLGRYQGPSSEPVYSRLGYHGMGNSIAELEDMKSVFVLGSELAAEQPIVFLRVRKACRFKGCTVINALDRSVEDTTSVGDFAAVNVQYRPGTELALINGILCALFTNKHVDVTSNPSFAAVQQSVMEWTPEKTAQETGVSASDISRASALLASGPMAIIAGTSVTEHPSYTDIAAALSNLAVITGNHGNLNIPGTRCNTQGAADMGVLPDAGPGYTPVSIAGMNTQQMLKAAETGDIKLLWILGADILNRYPDRGLAESALEKCPFIVINELTLTETASMADLILPVASMAEKDGTYTSCERRVQRIYRAFDVDSNMKTDWQIFSEIGERMGTVSTCVSSRDIWQEITSSAAGYTGLTLSSLGDGGVRWQYPATTAPDARVGVVKSPPPDTSRGGASNTSAGSA